MDPLECCAEADGGNVGTRTKEVIKTHNEVVMASCKLSGDRGNIAGRYG
jgi:hypothetical protein